jgi:glycosyltransferase involved in cell wall biosynthesis
VLDLLVISQACFREINRSVYRLLAHDGMKLELVAPKTLKISTGEKEADPPGLEDPPIHYLHLTGENPRVYRFEGLKFLLDKKLPRIVLLDNDPASMLAVKVGKWCKKNGSLLYCISCENLPLDIRSSYARRGFKGLPASFFKRVLLARTKRLIRGVFTINHDGEKLFIKEGYQNVVHMPLGFDPAYFHPDGISRDSIRTTYNLTNTVIAYFGRITPEKGVHILITALKDLKQFHWQLMMDAFDESASEYNAEINRLIRHSGIMDRTVFINPSHFEISSYMNAADYIIVPSVTTAVWKEQYGRVAAEALGCGKTVISSDSGALPELLQDHGILFKEGDVQGLQDILRNILMKHEPQPESVTRDISEYAFESLSIQRQKKVLEKAFQ